MNLVLVALIVAASAVVNLWITGRQRRADKREDYARQDKLRQEDKEARDAVAAQAAHAAELLLESNDRVAATAAATEVQLGEIKDIAADTNTVGKQTHTLVNSNMDEQKQFLLRSTERELAASTSMLALLESLGR